MTRVLVHRQVAEVDLPALDKANPEAAQALRDAIRQLESSTRGGRELDQSGWRAYIPIRGHAVIATGIGSRTVRIIAAGPLPALYDRERLREMAESVGITQSAEPKRREPGTPTPAPRARLVTLGEQPTPSTSTTRHR